MDDVQCEKCKGVFPASSFAGSSNRTTKHCDTCREKKRKTNEKNKEARLEHYQKNREARMKYRREYYEKNKDAQKQYSREYYEKNKAALQVRDREYARVRRATDVNLRVSMTKRGAEGRNLAFTISVDDARAMCQESCVYCGFDDSLVGIDRMDNSRGYVPGNCVPCCSKCNNMKGSLDVATFLKRCFQIAGIRDFEDAWPCDPPRLMRVYRTAAKSMKRVFELTKEEFDAVCALPCTFCRRAPTPPYHFTGIDRIDNGKGYVASNVQPACRECNMARESLSVEEFLQKIGEIAALWESFEIPVVMKPSLRHRPLKNTPVEQVDPQSGEVIKTHESVSACQPVADVSYPTMREALDTGNVLSGYVWRRVAADDEDGETEAGEAGAEVVDDDDFDPIISGEMVARIAAAARERRQVAPAAAAATTAPIGAVALEAMAPPLPVDVQTFLADHNLSSVDDEIMDSLLRSHEEDATVLTTLEKVVDLAPAAKRTKVFSAIVKALAD